MMCRFRSADELLQAIQESKFPVLIIPYDWTFAGTVKAELVDARLYLNVKGEMFPAARMDGIKGYVIETPNG